jgi:hypothetical protein
VCPDANLIWEPGKYADTHDVYFGTDWGDVNDANTSVDPNDVYKGNFDVNRYDPTPTGLLDFGETYYWRVDEVNDSCSPYLWKGTVWSITIESGQPYNPSPAISVGSIPTAGTTLSWKSSCLATQHDIYLSQVFQEVNESNSVALLGTTYDSDTDIESGALEFAKRYYWKVKDTGAVTLPEPDIWYFQAIGYPIMYFKFDGVLDANLPSPITDDTGNVTFEKWGSGELRYGQPNPTYNTLGTSADFKQNGTGGYGNTAGALFRSCFGPDLLDLDSSEYTIEAWVRHDGDANNTRGDIDMDGTIIRKERYSYGLGIDDDGTAKFMHAGNVIESESGRIELGNWYHIAAVFDAAADANQFQKLYVDGLVVADGNVDDLNPTDDYSTDHVGIGAYRYQGDSASHIANHFAGAIDELRVIDIAITESDFLIQGDANLAWLPRPYNGAKDVPYDTHLEWLPGIQASSHDVFIGTSWDDINDVNSSNIGSYPNVDYNNVDVNMEDLADVLDLGQMYYWRVDEVNDTTTDKWRGNIWQFTVAEYIIIDDMEDYDPGFSGYPITHYLPGDYGWDCGYTNGTGSLIDLLYPESVYAGIPPRRGDQGMYYLYDHSASLYSEISNHEDLEPNDWTAQGVKLLTLWFYGDPQNLISGVEQMYVGLEDTDSTYAEVRYPSEDVNDIAVAEWQEWNIALSQFSGGGVTLSSVDKLYIGFGDRDNVAFSGLSGNVYFDDFLLEPPRCVPSEAQPALDWNNDCIVDWGEIEIMAGDWLIGDVNLGEVVKPDPCVLHYEFEDGTGSNVTDSSGNNYDGTAIVEGGSSTDAFWEPNGVYGECIRFENAEKTYCVDVPNDVFADHITNQITISVWVNWDDPDTMPSETNQLFSMHGGVGVDYNDILGIETDWKDEGVSFWDANESVGYEVEEEDWSGGWNHYAFVKDVNVLPGSLKIYHNGQLVGDDDSNAPMIFPADNAWIGMATDSPNDVHDNYQGVWHDQYTGLLDDFTIYDYALSPAEIGYLATGGTGIVEMQSLVTNLINDEPLGEKAINFRDLAMLADDWFDEELWPE